MEQLFHITTRNLDTYLDISKYDSNGVPLWRALFDGPEHAQDRGILMTYDNDGNVIVVGQSAAPPSSIVILKYSH